MLADNACPKCAELSKEFELIVESHETSEQTNGLFNYTFACDAESYQNLMNRLEYNAVLVRIIYSADASLNNSTYFLSPRTLFQEGRYGSGTYQQLRSAFQAGIYWISNNNKLVISPRISQL